MNFFELPCQCRIKSFILIFMQMMNSLCLFLFSLTTDALIMVQIHRDVVYQPVSPCSFIRNTSWSTDASIQSCSWECVNEYNCQTAVYFDEGSLCTMYSELCDVGRLQSSAGIRADVICYRKSHDPVSTCPAKTTEVTAQETTTTETTMTTKIMYLPTYLYTLNISKCATWDSNGITVAGNVNGTAGSDLNSLNTPVGIFIDNSDTLFIGDRDNHRILKYNVNDTNGTVVAGNNGAGNGSNQLNKPKGVALDQYGFLIVGDSSNHRIQNFSNSSYGITVAISSTMIPFNDMLDLHIDNHNNIYVTDGTNGQITKSNWSNQTGIIFSSRNGPGSGADQFSNPFGNFVDIHQTWYISDKGNNRVQKWLPEGTNGTTVAGITGSAGSNMTQLNNPVAAVVDNNGYIYIADSANRRIMRWTDDYSVGGTCIVGCSNTSGKAPHQLSNPRYLRFDRHGNLYVTDQGNHRVQKFMINTSTASCSSSG